MLTPMEILVLLPLQAATEHLARVIKVLGLDDERNATMKAFSGSSSGEPLPL
jgi:hypothetical protein